MSRPDAILQVWRDYRAGRLDRQKALERLDRLTAPAPPIPRGYANSGLARRSRLVRT